MAIEETGTGQEPREGFRQCHNAAKRAEDRNAQNAGAITTEKATGNPAFSSHWAGVISVRKTSAHILWYRVADPSQAIPPKTKKAQKQAAAMRR
jgi:hypothetical protein